MRSPKELRLSENASGESARVLRLSVVCGNAPDVRSDTKVFHEEDNKSAAWRNNHLERNRFQVLRLRVPRQSRGDLEAIASDASTCFIDRRRSWKRVHARDVPSPYHLHGGYQPASSKRPTIPPERRGHPRPGRTFLAGYRVFVDRGRQD